MSSDEVIADFGLSLGARWCHRGLCAPLFGALAFVTSCSIAAAESREEVNVAKWAQPGRCGTNVLYVMLRLLGRDISYDEVFAATPTDPVKGVSLQDLRESASRLGLDAEVRRVDLGDIPRLQPPFILHLDLADIGGTGHFVAVTDLTETKDQWQVGAVDGAKGVRIQQLLENLRPVFLGYVLVPASARTSRGLGGHLPHGFSVIVAGVLIGAAGAALCLVLQRRAV